jgi:ribosomal protein L7Ae-like RNA K-turn-binding protein
LWTLARRDIVAAAVAKKLFARVARESASADPGLVDRVEKLLARRCGATLGLARRAGQAVGGFEKVRALIERGACGLMVIAAEASGEGRRKVVSGVEALPVVGVLTEVELGVVFGRESVTYAAVTRGGNAQRCLEDGSRLSGFRAAA